MSKQTMRVMAILLAMAMVFGNAYAQGDAGSTPAQAPAVGGGAGDNQGKGGRGGMGRGNMGKVVSISADSIVLASFRPDGQNRTVALDKTAPVTVSKLTVAKLEEIKGEKWATVRARGGGQQDEAAAPTDTIQASNIVIVDKQPEKAEAKSERGITTGKLTVENGVASVKVGDKTYKLETNERSRIYTAAPAKMEDVKADTIVMLTTKEVEGNRVATEIGILPADTQLGGQGGGNRGGGAQGGSSSAAPGGQGQ